ICSFLLYILYNTFPQKYDQVYFPTTVKISLHRCLKRRINNVFYTTRAPITPWESRRQPLLQTFLIALPAEHAAKFFQPFFLPGLAGSLFLWYHALQK
ncbi:MAG: hypothetical protein WAW64_01725, partial [Gemmiger qucibialis]